MYRRTPGGAKLIAASAPSAATATSRTTDTDPFRTPSCPPGHLQHLGHTVISGIMTPRSKPGGVPDETGHQHRYARGRRLRSLEGFLRGARLEYRTRLPRDSLSSGE